MADIYETHRKAFADVSAYVVMKGGTRVATIAFKFPKDGAGRLYAYVHWIGVEMVRGFASGYGYDKRSAACADAIAKRHPGPQGHASLMALPSAPYADFARSLIIDNGREWRNALRDAGFEVIQAV